MRLISQFSVVRWTEKSYDEQLPDGKKLSQADIVYAVAGDLQGRAYVQSLMVYTCTDKTDPHKSEATYVSVWKFEGSLAGKEGSFILIEQGTYAGGSARGILNIVSGSGSGALQGIEGAGQCTAEADRCMLVMDCSAHVL